ncbi:MAG: hypothetical protein E7425_14350 [Ruminococcaceae bacterium]|nr:hypothetical protein [Oscillospiraceae bacterium]
MKEKLFCLLFAAALALGLTACGSKKENVRLSGMDAMTALKTAKLLSFDGSLNDTDAPVEIVADKQIVGQMQADEADPKDIGMLFLLDGEQQLRYKIITTGKIVQDSSIDATYGCFDTEGRCYGYIQLRHDGGNSWYVFLDPIGDEKEYRLTSDLKQFYKTENAKASICTVERKLDDVMTHDFQIKIKNESSDIKVDYYDKLGVYWIAWNALREGYSYLLG